MFTTEKANVVEISLLADNLLNLLNDESVNTRKVAVRSLKECFDTLQRVHFNSALKVFYAILRTVQSNSYWLLKTEVTRWV